MIATIATIPFGRHKGKRLSQVPPAYLDWCLTLPNLTEDLKRAIIDYQSQADQGRQNTIATLTAWFQNKLSHNGKAVFTPAECKHLATLGARLLDKRL